MKWAQLCSSLNILWHYLSLGLEWKWTFFQSCGHCWVFQICWHIECSTFTASSFRIWNSSARIPLLQLVLFIAMLLKDYLTLHSKMPGSRWVITTSWFSGSLISFLYSSSVYSCHLFLICSASVRSIPFLSFIEPIFAWNFPLVFLIFLKRCLVFPFCCFPLFLCIDRWGRLSYLFLLFFGILHSNGYIFPFLHCFSLLFFSQLFIRPPQTTILPFCISFSWRWFWFLLPTMSQTSVHSSSGTLSIRSNLLNLFFTSTATPFLVVPLGFSI